jgi:hypothetical protein
LVNKRGKESESLSYVMVINRNETDFFESNFLELSGSNWSWIGKESSVDFQRWLVGFDHLGEVKNFLILIDLVIFAINLILVTSTFKFGKFNCYTYC